MLKNLIKLLEDEEGATALEYGLMAAAVAGRPHRRSRTSSVAGSATR